MGRRLFGPWTAVASGGNAVWTPASLPGLVAAPVVALMRSASKLWQGRNYTGALAAADTDPVGSWECTFTGVRGAAPSDAARAVLADKGGGKWSIKPDGVDDSYTLSLNCGIGNGSFGYAAAGVPPTDGPYRALVSVGGFASPALYVRLAKLNGFFISDTTEDQPFNTTLSATPCVFWYQRHAGVISAAVNGVAEATTYSSSASSGSDAYTLFNTAFNQAWSEDFYGGLIVEGSSFVGTEAYAYNYLRSLY